MLVRRRAVGATVAATLVFSTLLLTNLSLLAAATQRERLSLTANSESLLGDTATMLGGSEGLGLLDSLQSFLSSRSFQCPSVADVVGNYTSSLSTHGNEDGVTVSEALTPGRDTTVSDNLTILKPFNGSQAGEINVDLAIRSSGASPLGDVTYVKTERHRLHLPVQLNLMVTLCEGSAEDVRSLLQGQSFASCSNSSLGPPIEALAGKLQSQASAEGLDFTIEYRVGSSQGCSVTFNCLVEQPEVAGPSGAFSVRLEQVGVASVRVEG